MLAVTGHAYRDLVPNQPKTQNKTVRIDTPKWLRFGTAAEAQGTDRSKALNQFIDWYLNEPGAELPERPATAQLPRPSADATEADATE